MSVSAIAALGSSTLTASTSSTEATTGTDALGQDAFLQLLLAELGNQDPFNPMQDRDFVAQLAQLNSLNELTEINDTLSEMNDALAELSNSDSASLTDASALLGKVVTGKTESGSTVTGTVTGLYLVDGDVTLYVDDTAVPLDGITQVTEPEEETEAA
jgi:flagellar basal-body rod modification protein FlgD